MFKLLTLFFIISSAAFGANQPSALIAEPIPYLDQNLKRDYLAPANQYSAGHRGVDFEVLPGDSLASPVNGTVTFKEKVVNRQVLTITDPIGRKFSFEPVCSDLTAGESVAIGEEIGWPCPGEADYQQHCQDCVHFSVRTNFGYISPLYLLGKLQPSALKV